MTRTSVDTSTRTTNLRAANIDKWPVLFFGVSFRIVLAGLSSVLTLVYAKLQCPLEMQSLPQFWLLWVTLAAIPFLHAYVTRRQINVALCMISISLIIYLELSVRAPLVLLSYFFINLIVVFSTFKGVECHCACVISYAFGTTFLHHGKNVVEMEKNTLNYISDSQVCTACIFLWVLIHEHILRRIKCRLWDHVHFILIMREKIKRCNLASRSMIKSHYCPVIIQAIFSPTAHLHSQPESASPIVTDSSTNEQSPQQASQTTHIPYCGRDGENVNTSPFLRTVDEHVYSQSESVTSALPNSVTENDKGVQRLLDSILREQVPKGEKYRFHVNDPFHETYLPDNDQISRLEGLESRFCALIAISIFQQEDPSLLTDIFSYGLYDIVSELALKHKIAHLRNFGSTWIGCHGFFEGEVEVGSSDGPAVELQRRENICHRALLMACEVVGVFERMGWKVRIAVDASTILGGFLHGSVAVFGPQVRWVCHVAQESQNQEYAVLMSSDLKNILSRSEIGSEARRIKNYFDWRKVRISTLSSNHTNFYEAESAYGIPSPQTVVEPKDEDILLYRRIFREYPRSTVSPDYLHLLADVKEMQNFKKVEANSLRPREEFDLETLADEWSMNVPPDVLTSLPLNFTAAMTDAAISHLSDEEYISMHSEITCELLKWVFQEHFKKSLLRFMILYSPGDLSRPTNTSKINEILGRPLPRGQATAPIEVLKSELSGFANSVVYAWIRLRSFFSSLRSSMVVDDGDDDGDLQGTEPPLKYTSKMNSWTKYRWARWTDSAKSYHQSARVVPQNTSLHDEAISSDQAELGHYPRSTVKPSSVTSDFTIPPTKTSSGLPVASSHKAKIQIEAKPSTVRVKSLQVFKNEMLVISSNPLVSFFVHILFVVAILWSTNHIANQYLGADGLSALSFSISRGDSSGLNIAYVVGVFVARAIFDRTYDHLVYFFYLALLPFIIFKLPILRGNVLSFAPESTATSYYGHVTIDSIVLTFFAGVIMVEFRRSFKMSFIQCAFVSMLFLIRVGNQNNRNVVLREQHVWHSILLSIIAYLACCWYLDFITIILYLTELKVGPTILKSYERCLQSTYQLLKRLEPAVTHNDKGVLKPQQHQDCVIISISVKAAVLLTDILQPAEFSFLYSQILALIDLSIRECGLCKATEFGGTTIVFISRNFEVSNPNSNSMSLTQRAMTFINSLHQRTDAFGVKQGFSVELDIGVDYGPAIIGIQGNLRHCFDVTGITRDLAYIAGSASSATSGNPQTIASNSFVSIDERKLIGYNDVFKKFSSRACTYTFRGSKLVLHKFESSVDGISLDDFELVALLGKGGYGSVHLVRDVKTARRFAIKVIPQKSNCAFAKMAREEFMVLQQLQHKNVITFNFCLMANSRMYLVMKYVEGGTLKQLMERHHPPIAHLAFWFEELVSALDYVHSCGIIHRDVKPANCLIDTDGHLQLSDFGLSKNVRKLKSSEMRERDHDAEKSLTGTRGSFAALRSASRSVLQKLMPLKSMVKEDFKDTPYDIVVVPVSHSGLSLSYVRNKLRSTKEALNSMFFDVQLSESFEEAKTIYSSGKISRGSVVIFELIAPLTNSSSKRHSRAGSSETFESTEQGSVNPNELTENLKLALSEMDDSTNVLSGIPVLVLTPPEYYSLEIQVNLQNQYKNLKHFLAAPLKLTDREQIRYVGGFARGLEMKPVVEEEESSMTGTKGSTDDIKTGTGTHSSQTGSDFHHDKLPRYPLSVANENVGKKFADDNLAELDLTKEAVKSHRAGTAHYMAPEVILRGEYSFAVDWWGCGVTFYQCAVGKHLFSVEGNDQKELFELICEGDIYLGELRDVSAPLENLVSKLLNRDVPSRIGSRGANAIKMHPFFAQSYRLRGVPPFRPTAEPIEPTAPKSIKLFYGSRYHPQRPTGPPAAQPAVPFSNRGSYSSNANSAKKKFTDARMKRELAKFSSVSALRRQWLRGPLLEQDEFKQQSIAEETLTFFDASSFSQGEKDNSVSELESGAANNNGPCNAFSDWDSGFGAHWNR